MVNQITEKTHFYHKKIIKINHIHETSILLQKIHKEI
jgi:hypothetical protein